MVSERLDTVQKIWFSGTTMCIAVPVEVRKIFELNKGDYIKISWGEVIKGENIKKSEEVLKKELPKL